MVIMNSCENTPPRRPSRIDWQSTSSRGYHICHAPIRGAIMAFVYAAKAGDIAPGQIREISVGGMTIALANVGGQFHALSNTCLHRGGPLGQGSMQGNLVTCPWHGWTYDVTSGKVSGSQSVGLDRYSVELRGDDVYVDIGTHT